MLSHHSSPTWLYIIPPTLSFLVHILSSSSLVSSPHFQITKYIKLFSFLPFLLFEEMETELGKLYISGMSWITTENKLNQYFSKYGLVKESVIFLNVDTNHSTGFGSIIFEDPFVLSSVLQQTHYIDNYPVSTLISHLI